MRDHTDPRDIARLLPLSGEQPNREPESENDREPDQPHGGTSVEGGWRESSRSELWTVRSVHCVVPPQRQTTLRALSLTAVLSITDSSVVFRPKQPPGSQGRR